MGDGKSASVSIPDCEAAHRELASYGSWAAEGRVASPAASPHSPRPKGRRRPHHAHAPLEAQASPHEDTLHL